jgi:phenylalanine-4-hydroxylase
MRQNYSYLKDIAYYPYIPGLEAAGLTIEKIPDLQEMNNALKKIGWGAVTVDGFIPPSAFMEYQSYRVLVIAADIRQLHHIEYTPAPDIIHESAGHAPIIADKDYHEYLSYFGSIGAKAMFSSKDFDLYESIRELSILKEMRGADPVLLRKAEKRVDFCQKNLGEPSEMALLSRLHWWTVEYGLIGTLKEPKIYGAGLLSSIGESTSCMNPNVTKYWYTLDAINYPFDITQPQPQLFVTPDFQNLITVLEKFADTMAFRRGGAESVLKAIECKNICTAVFSSGLQVSGVFTDLAMSRKDELQYIKTNGPSALAFSDKELEGHGRNYHSDGFSSPVGRLRGFERPLEEASDDELKVLGLVTNEVASLYFESGFVVNGKVQNILRKNARIALITFSECTVKNDRGEIFFEPIWGNYDMAVGEKVISVYCGAADKDAFEEIAIISKTSTHHPEYDQITRKYHELFRQVRYCRENHSSYDKLLTVWEDIRSNFREDWLCSMEILEVLDHENIYHNVARDIRIYLEMKASNEPALTKLIRDGFYLIKNPVNQLTN